MRNCNVAVVGATGLVGREILDVLDQRQFPVGDLRLYASPRSAGERIECGELSARVESCDTASFAGCEIVFVAAREVMSPAWVENVTSFGAILIDATQTLAADLDVPLVVPEVNPEDLAGYAVRGAVASPDPTAIAAAIILHPLREVAGVRRVVVTTVEPASGAGRAGIDELQKQSVSLMQGLGVEASGPTFPQRIAFNLFPQVGALASGESSSDEAVTIESVRRLLDQPDLGMSLTRVRVPMFFGHGLAINVETLDPLMASAVVAVLREAPGILLEEPSDEVPYPTPATTIGQDAVAVGRVRADPESSVIDVWAVLDNVRKGAAVNAVQIAELLLRDHLGA